MISILTSVSPTIPGGVRCTVGILVFSGFANVLQVKSLIVPPVTISNDGSSTFTLTAYTARRAQKLITIFRASKGTIGL